MTRITINLPLVDSRACTCQRYALNPRCPYHGTVCLPECIAAESKEVQR